MNFLEKLDKLMLEKGINKPKLAELSGVPYTTIDGFYKKGYTNIKLGNLRKIAAALGTPVEDLIDDDPDAPEKLSFEARQFARAYDSLDIWGRRAVQSVLTEEQKRLAAAAEAAKPATRIIPLLGSRFAAGVGEPDFGNALEEYEIPFDTRADFAVHVHGDSMEPWLPDGSIQLGVKGMPEDGDVAALIVDGAFYIKQICLDHVGNMYLFSLNRARKDLDLTVWASAESHVSCFGKILMPKRLPLPLD